jgi:hypothetical protein
MHHAPGKAILTLTSGFLVGETPKLQLGTSIALSPKSTFAEADPSPSAMLPPTCSSAAPKTCSASRCTLCYITATPTAFPTRHALFRPTFDELRNRRRLPGDESLGSADCIESMASVRPRGRCSVEFLRVLWSTRSSWSTPDTRRLGSSVGSPRICPGV